MGDVLQMNGFISQLLPRLNISSERTHIAIVIFGKHARVVVGLNEAKFHNVEALDRFMQNGIPNGRASRTRIDKGLVEANNKVFVEKFGDRPEFPNVLVLITDGKTHRDSEPFPGIVSSLKVRPFACYHHHYCVIIIIVLITIITMTSTLEEDDQSVN